MRLAVSAVNVLTRWAAYVSVACLIVLMLLVSMEVFLRYLFEAPTTWGSEVASYVLVALIFFAMAEAMRRERHVRAEVLLDLLFPAARRLVMFLTTIPALLAVIALLVVGFQFAMRAYGMGEVSVVIPSLKMFLPKLIVPLGALLFALQILVRMQSYLQREDNAPAE